MTSAQMHIFPRILQDKDIMSLGGSFSESSEKVIKGMGCKTRLV